MHLPIGILEYANYSIHEKILAAGGSDYPRNILAREGIDITKKDFWQQGFDIIEKDVEALEKLL
ncbi:MAG: hypothetical protein U9Q69_03410 [Nanoarchaeota archaeon]|nr:hypothetical protein [Nanoarchaeota archaeon]